MQTINHKFSNIHSSFANFETIKNKWFTLQLIFAFSLYCPCTYTIILVALECDQPHLKDLHNHVVPNVADRWKDLGMELLNPKPFNRTLEIIGADNSHSVEKCCRQMFHKWLDTKLDANWSQLIMALKNIGLVKVANHIHDMLKKGTVPVSTYDIRTCNFNEMFQKLYSLCGCNVWVHC